MLNEHKIYNQRMGAIKKKKSYPVFRANKNEEKREAGGQGEFFVGLAARRCFSRIFRRIGGQQVFLTHPRCRVTTNNVALKKTARSWRHPCDENCVT
jgi:hypothetical protein